MPEFTDPDEEFAFFKHDDSDRAVGVILGAIVENRLTDILKMAMRKDDRTFEELFGPQGPLFNFGMKIRLGYMLGILGKEMRDDLIRVNKIRNSFAHSVSVKDFQSQPIADYLSHLKLLHTYDKLLETKKEELRKNPPIATSERKPAREMKLSKRGEIFTLERELADNRSRYRFCIRMLIGFLHEIEKKVRAADKMYFGPSAQATHSASQETP